MRDWQKLRQVTKKVGFRNLVFKYFRLPDGSEREFTTYGLPGAQDVAVIALTPYNKVLVARQFRPGPEKVLDELPGGSADPGEDPEAAVRRELLEETGYAPTRLEYLGLAHRDAYSNAEAHYFIGYECVKKTEPELEEGEHIEVDIITIDQLLDNMQKGKMTDAPAVAMAQDRLKKMRR